MTKDSHLALGIGDEAAKRISERLRTNPRRRFAQSTCEIHTPPADVRAQDTQPPCAFPGELDEFDRDLLQFAVKWAPYGGPPAEDLLPEFGITSQQLVPRILAIAARHYRGPMSPGDRDLLTEVLHHSGILPARSHR